MTEKKCHGTILISTFSLHVKLMSSVLSLNNRINAFEMTCLKKNEKIWPVDNLLSNLDRVQGDESN